MGGEKARGISYAQIRGHRSQMGGCALQRGVDGSTPPSFAASVFACVVPSAQSSLYLPIQTAESCLAALCPTRPCIIAFLTIRRWQVWNLETVAQRVLHAFPCVTCMGLWSSSVDDFAVDWNPCFGLLCGSVNTCCLSPWTVCMV